MTNSQIQESIVQNLLLGLEKQSKYYLDRLEDKDLTPTEAKDIDKELLDINNVLSQVSNKTINYTVAELEALRVTFNQRLEQLNQVISNLEINTLKIEFDTLTVEQKEFLKVKGDKGDKGDGAYELAKRYGFEGNEVQYLESLKGKDGNFEDLTESQKNLLRGQNGLSAYELALKNGFSGTEQEYLTSLKGKDGNDGENGLSSYELALKNGFSGTEQEYLESLKSSSTGGNISLDNEKIFFGILPYMENFINYGEFNKEAFERDQEYKLFSNDPALIEKLKSFQFPYSENQKDWADISIFYGSEVYDFLKANGLITSESLLAFFRLQEEGYFVSKKEDVFGSGGTYTPNPRYVPLLMADYLNDEDVENFKNALISQFPQFQNFDFSDFRKELYPRNFVDMTVAEKQKTDEIEIFTINYLISNNYDIKTFIQSDSLLKGHFIPNGYTFEKYDEYNNPDWSTIQYQKEPLLEQYAIYSTFLSRNESPVYNDILVHLRALK